MSTLYPHTEPGDEIDLAEPPTHCALMVRTSTDKDGYHTFACPTGDYELVTDPNGIVFDLGRKRRPRGGAR